jgi:ferric-dicitrate binding protein FerR (iron transport regulator)
MSFLRDQSPNPKLQELFLRYWDNTLTDGETVELNRLLAEDSMVQKEFSTFLMQIVAIHECQVVSRPTLPFPNPSLLEPAQERPPPTQQVPQRLSRRQVLGWSGLAVGVAASIVFGVREWVREKLTTSHRSAILASASGTVRVGVGNARSIAAGQVLQPGDVVSTVGPNSSASLTYPDGSTITLTGDSTISLAKQGHGLVLQRGVASADIRLQAPGTDLLTLATAQVILPRLGAVVMTLGQSLQATEVEVYQGRVTVSAPTGERLADVQGGEMLTVHADGDHEKKLITPTPDEFSWDLSLPLPEGWHVGVREVTTEGPVVRPEVWFDPYHRAEMSQIRSNQQWSRGFFRLFPESVIRVRYRVDRPGPSQMCFCVRTADARTSSTGMLEYNKAFAAARAHEWQWLEVRGADLLDNPHTPTFGPPWVGFLVIFNTYKVDLGLSIAEFHVTRPDRLD